MATPLVLLHGFAGHADSWNAVRRALHDRPVHALTAFGHDHECTVTGTVSFEDEVERTSSFIRELGEPVRLAGYSMGGRLALGVLATAPHLVASAVLIGTNPGLKDRDERTARAAADAEWSRILDDEGLGVFLDRWQAQALFASQRQLPSHVLGEQAALRRRHDARSLSLAMTSLSLARMPSYWDALSSFEQPIELVVGSLDTKFTALAQSMTNLLPNGRVVVVESAGHNVLLESPARLARILADDPPRS